MNGVAAVCGLTGILAFLVGLVLFLPADKLKPYRKSARRLSVAGASLFAIGVVITPNAALPNDQRTVNKNANAGTPTDSSGALNLEPIPRTPDHNYISRSGNVYYYAGEAISDNGFGDRSARDVHGFEYAGRDLNPDNDTVYEVNSVGMPIHTLWCENPCSVIHAEDGQMLSYEPSSIIGMVFQDIADGKLKSINLKPIQAPHAVGASSIY